MDTGNYYFKCLMTFSLKHNELLSCSVALGRICDLHAYRCTKEVLDFLTEQYNSRTCIVVTIFSQMLEWEINA